MFTAYGFMVFPVASLLSVKRALLIISTAENILEVKFFQTLAGSQLLSSETML